MDDLISRKAAIDALNEYFARIGKLKKRGLTKGEKAISLDTVGAIKTLPSAQPEERTEERTETHACDLINRQAAIEVIDAVFPVDPMKSEYAQGIACGAALAKTYVKQLPSAQPEPPEWAQKVDEYRKSAPSFVRNQLVWALYQTWKEYDGRLVHQRGKENR